MKTLREETVKELKKVRLKGRLKFAIYLPKENRESFEIALRWAHTKGLIAKPTNWAFTKFAVMNVIEMINNEIEKERVQKENEEMAQRVYNSPTSVPGNIRLD